MKLKEINGSAAYIILGIILAFGINQGLALALSTDIPVVAVESNSMVPTFQKGDILVLQGVDAENLIIGDIIVFEPLVQETPVVHRVIQINDDGTVQTKGDANSKQLPFEMRIQETQIHGKVISIVPYLGWVKIGMSEYILPNLHWVIMGAVLIIVLYMIMYNKL